MNARTFWLAALLLGLVACNDDGGDHDGGAGAGPDNGSDNGGDNGGDNDGDNGGNDPGGDDQDNGDPDQPSGFSLRSSSPPDGANQLDGLPVTAIFNQPVDRDSVDSLSFAVTAGVNPVPGTFSFSEDSSVVSFTPEAPLVDGQTYTVTLNGDIQNQDDETLAEASWQFTVVTFGDIECQPGTPPASLNLDPYYTQYCDASGMPILGGAQVSPQALIEAWYRVVDMTLMRQDLLARMVDNGTRVVVVANDEGITQIPEYANLDQEFPLEGGMTWDERSRGLGATPYIPVSSGAEENLLCYGSSEDPYDGEDIFIHEFSHSIVSMALADMEPDFLDALDDAYQNALDQGLFENTYAALNVEEYWAEGVQDWYNANLESDPPNGIHNSINTREELAEYDPTLYALISRVLPAQTIDFICEAPT